MKKKRPYDRIVAMKNNTDHNKNMPLNASIDRDLHLRFNQMVDDRKLTKKTAIESAFALWMRLSPTIQSILIMELEENTDNIVNKIMKEILIEKLNLDKTIEQIKIENNFLK